MDGKQLEPLRDALKKLFEVVSTLQQLFPGRPFTPDGHLVGSLGEAIAQRDFDLELVGSGTDGYDAVSGDRRIEIKATFSDACVTFRDKHPSHLIVLRLSSNGDARTVYNGQFGPVRALIDEVVERTDWPSNGQIPVRLNKLAELNMRVEDGERIPSRGKDAE